MILNIDNSSFYFERFYTSLIFSCVTFLFWILLKNKIKKPIREDKFKNSNEFYSWYFQYKFYLILKFLLFISIGTLIISIVSLIQFLMSS